METFTITPSGITHHASPVFAARWLSGALTAPEESQQAFFYEGSGGNDRLLIYGIEWQGEQPAREQFLALMDTAITALDRWIAARL